MTIEDVIAQIEGLEKQKSILEAGMIADREIIISDVCKHYKEKIDTLIKFAVEKCYENTKKLSQNNLLIEMKAKVVELRDKSDAIIIDLFSKSDALNYTNLNLRYHSFSSGTQYTQGIKNELNSKIFNPASKLIGDILVEYGYLDIWNPLSSWTSVADYYIYPHMSDGISVNNYADKYAKYLETLQRLLEYKKLKEQKEAIGEWDKI